MNSLIVLVHIPKTGGTSLRVAASHYYGREGMLYDYGTAARLTSPLVREFVYEKKDLPGFAERVASGPFRFLSGHVSLNKYRRVFPDARFVSWVREPVARLWSSYRHNLNKRGFKGSFRDFFSQPGYRNQQTAFLGNDLEQFSFIGITEYFDLSLGRFNERFGVNFVEHRSNRSRVSFSSGPSTEERAEIEELNADDFALYREVEGRLLGEP